MVSTFDAKFMEKKELRISPRCPIRTSLELLAGKWKLLLIQQIGHDTLRYGSLKRRVPDISEKMLIQELKHLVDSKLVHRKNYGEVPPRVEYSLSKQGKKVLPLIQQLQNFGLEYMDFLKEEA